ncbi:uncharacterized protein C8Q71DRAFT_774504 [Rhodofomes roseus]|uniref:Uncharacterized protein n=1 Tax=Rhodofomes roseus TaxID=34475 RepID=A0ABQ8K7E2_9APHY|nr:uncharacterized protein C8Q71DRAFT_774504 [Rhodofomes roseus]KAH9833181.1 hypothetical protein C8Q71DRAFT_774504 [Rhodofomes roseus]
MFTSTRAITFPKVLATIALTLAESLKNQNVCLQALGTPSKVTTGADNAQCPVIPWRRKGSKLSGRANRPGLPTRILFGLLKSSSDYSNPPQMSSCLLCLSREQSPHHTDQCEVVYDASEPAIAGDIYGGEQSVNTPISLILAQTLDYLGRSRTHLRLDGSLRSGLTGQSIERSTLSSMCSNLRGKYRPCIIDDTVAEGRTNVAIYLMATYGSKPLETMPDIHRHFSLAVYPNQGGAEHVHTTPEWKGKRMQWIIAFKYDVPAHVLRQRWFNRWRNVQDNRMIGSNHRFGPEVMGYLDAQSTKKMNRWQRKCFKDPSLIDKMVDACLSNPSRLSCRGSHNSAGRTNWRCGSTVSSNTSDTSMRSSRTTHSTYSTASYDSVHPKHSGRKSKVLSLRGVDGRSMKISEAPSLASIHETVPVQLPEHPTTQIGSSHPSVRYTPPSVSFNKPQREVVRKPSTSQLVADGIRRFTSIRRIPLRRSSRES